MVLGAVLGGLSAVTGIAGALGGSRSAKRRARATKSAYNRYFDTRRNVNQAHASQLQQSAQARDSLNLQFAQAMNSVERAESIGQRQGQAQAGLESMLKQAMLPEGTQRTGAAKQAAGAQASETGQAQGRLQEIFGAVAATQGAQAFQAQQNPLLEQLQVGRQASNESAIAQNLNAQNQATLDQRLAQIGAQPQQNDFTGAMNLLSPMLGAGSIIASTFAPGAAAGPAFGPEAGPLAPGYTSPTGGTPFGFDVPFAQPGPHAPMQAPRLGLPGGPLGGSPLFGL